MANEITKISSDNATPAQFFKAVNIKEKFEEVLGDKQKTESFVASVLAIVNDTPELKKVDNSSIMAAAMKAAVLDLPVEKSLGFAYVIPYYNSRTRKHEAQFQIGYKGYIQLAQRSGVIAKISRGKIYENQFLSYDPLDEKLEADFSVEGEGEVAGYFAKLILVNGFSHLVYWSKEKVEKHRDKFSKAKSYGPWKDNFDAMALKTVIKDLLRDAPMSLQMQIREDGTTGNYKTEAKDVTPDEPETLEDLIPHDEETGEIIDEPEQLDLGVSYEDPNAK
ncbi:recombinase RecT [Lactococcus garvieae]|uniref:Recombination protein RecT n=1 Tax=Lactococcus garvieae TaxID=1363 RepID=A0A1I4IKY5_9LACT|nr:recombinase RecT [Lactococcus garvieae]SFL54998.1 recombination protein RecT [Lactococcus garvieae]